MSIDSSPHLRERTGETPDCTGGTWLSDDVLLVVVPESVAKPGAGISLVLSGSPIRLQSAAIAFVADEESHPVTRRGALVVASLPAPQRALRTRRELDLTLGDERGGSSNVRVRISDIRVILRDCLASLSPAARATLLEFCGTAASSLTARPLQVSHSLVRLREGLRERLPKLTIQQSNRLGLSLDSVLMVGGDAGLAKGWIRDSESEIVRLTLVSPEGARAELFRKATFHPRPDVDAFYGVTGTDQGAARGFTCFFELGAPSHEPVGWLLEIENADGAGGEIDGPPVQREAVAVRGAILSSLALERSSFEDLLANQVHPAISRLQLRIESAVHVSDESEYGSQPAQPEVSIIIPLYRDVSLIEQQLADFAHDPEVAEADIIYVLDSPELTDATKALASQLALMYRVPFRVAVLAQNVGYAGATNAGARLARGRLLLLLNSDVFPHEPGWLGRMVRFYDQTPNIGALGAKLVYEDDSLQHAGLYFNRNSTTGMWENAHYFKGIHETLPAANVAREVPAVTGACLMISRETFQKAGGLSGAFVQGDYEDSDLCLRLREFGLHNWYFPEAKLYHLEGMSYAPGPRGLNRKYNTWLHSRTWDERITALMANAAFSASQ